MSALKHYREAAGLTQQELATAAETSQPQILRLEKSKRKLTKEWAERLAPHLRIAAETLMFPPSDLGGAPSVTTPEVVTAPPVDTGSKPVSGAGDYFKSGSDGSQIRLGGRIVGGGAIDVSTEQDQPGIEYEVGLSVRIPDGVVAYQVVGESMMPVYRPNTVIICRAHTTDIDPHLGREVAVGTREHGRMLKTIHAGSKAGHFDLESLNALTLRDVPVVWVARIAAIIPADEWHLIEREIQTQAANAERLKKPSQRQRLRKG